MRNVHSAKSILRNLRDKCFDRSQKVAKCEDSDVTGLLVTSLIKMKTKNRKIVLILPNENKTNGEEKMKRSS